MAPNPHDFCCTAKPLLIVESLLAPPSHFTPVQPMTCQRKATNQRGSGNGLVLNFLHLGHGPIPFWLVYAAERESIHTDPSVSKARWR